MTGEITLRGLVLPVGGIKEKVLAAMRAGIKTIILPSKNEKDLEEIPERIRNEMTFKFIQRMDEAVEFALRKEPDGHLPKEEWETPGRNFQSGPRLA